MSIQLIFAHGPNGEFGKDKGLPWYSPIDLEHFKKYTMDSVLVMNSTTFNSLPGKLPGRLHVVYSKYPALAKNGSEPDVIVSPDKMTLEEVCGMFSKKVSVIGGRELLLKAASICDSASVTLIEEECEASHFIDYKAIEDLLHIRMRVQYTERPEGPAGIGILFKTFYK